MEASILVVGGAEFLEQLREPIHNLERVTLEVAADPREAVSLIQAQQPDLLILRADQPGSLELCHQVKNQHQLAWIYCIVVGHPPQEPSGYWEVETQVEALEAGADAFVWLPQSSDGSDSTNQEQLATQNRLLTSQIRVGLRRVQNYRELIRTNDILSAIALSDPLTELNNRRALEWELPRQISNARSRKMPLSLLMLDVDYFKTINDRYGHLVGDRALQLLSARLRHNLRFYDTPFRYGGEEFVIILSDTDSQEARAIGTRLCRLIAEQPFVINDSLSLSITISAGAATLQLEDDSNGLNLLRRADTNLLSAKAQGRNRVVALEDVSA